MTTILRNLVRLNAVPLFGFWLLGPLAVLVVTLTGGEERSQWAAILRLPLILPMNYMLFVVAIMAAVVHLPVHVAHGAPRRRIIAATGIFAVAVSLLFGTFTSLGNYLYDRYLTDPGMVTNGDLPHSIVAHSAINLAYMVGGWLIGLAYYRYHPWIATALLPLAAAPMIGAEEATNQIWSNSGYMYTIGNYAGRFGFWTDFALVGACIIVGAAAGLFFGDRLPLRAKRA